MQERLRCRLYRRRYPVCLKKVLAQESLRADAFKELIDVAEKQFNISIRKKSWRQVVRNLHAKAPEHYRVAGLCRLFGVTKQAYYKYDKNRLLERVAGKEFAVFYIRDVRKKDPGIGGLKLWHMYRRDFEGSHPLSRDHFADIVERYGLKVRQKVRRPRTTDSTHGLPVFPNLIKDYIPLAPDRLWVSDITYITIWCDAEHYRFCYLSLILDAYSEEIVGCAWAGPSMPDIR